MAVWYAHSSNVDINAANLWHTHPTNNTPVNFAMCDNTVVLSANGKTQIRINVNVTCLRLSTAIESGGAVGGSFYYTGTDTAGNPVGPLNIICDVKSTTYCIIVLGETLLTITGNILSTSNQGALFLMGDDAKARVIGNVESASSTETILQVGNSSELTIDGNVTGSTNAESYGVWVTGSNAVITINGDVTGGTEGCALSIDGQYSQAIINGDVKGGTYALGLGVISHDGHIRINGNIYAGHDCPAVQINVEAANITLFADEVYGGGAQDMHGIYNSATNGQITVKKAIGGSGEHACGIFSEATESLNVIITEAVIGGTNRNAYGFESRMGNGGAIIKGNIIDSLTCSAVAGRIRVDVKNANYYQMYDLNDKPKKYGLNAASPFRRSRFV